MKAYQPESLEELKAVLAESGPDTALLAGGTDWIIRQRKNGREPAALVYLGSLPELKLLERQADGLFVGAGCTMAELERSPLLNGPYTVLAEAAAGVGSVQIRNRATVGGNIANASPAADTAAPLLCLDAAAQVLRRGEVLEIPVSELITGSETTVLQPHDVILGFRVPERPADAESHYYKLGFRRQVSISRFGVAIALRREEGVVTEARVAVGAIGPKAVRMPAMEQALLGRRPEEAAAETGALLADYIRHTSGRRYKAWASAGVMEDALGMFQKKE